MSDGKKQQRAITFGLDEPASYFPLADGRYHVTPQLFNFGTDFGNGEADRRFYQIDSDFFSYRDAKLEARRERLDKYFIDRLSENAVHRRIHSHIIKRLLHEYPDLFEMEIGNRVIGLHAHLTDEVLVFDREYQYQETLGNHLPNPGYQNGMDALACQIQEDIAVVSLHQGRDQISALHLCFPNHWAAEEKIGQSFSRAHEPVAGMAKVNAKATQIVSSMVHRGPFVRFAWGIATDQRLNHHPVTPPGRDALQWLGRRFDPGNNSLFLRVERQTLNGFADIHTALFTIRTSFRNLADMKESEPNRIRAVCAALRSMSDEQLQYKGLGTDRQAILDWLESP